MPLKQKKGIQWVDLSAALTPEVPAPGTIIEFRFTETSKDFRQNGGSFDRFKNEVSLRPIFNVQSGNDLVLVGLVGSFDNQGNPNVGEVMQLDFKPQELGGVLYLTPVAEDGSIDAEAMDKYNALSLHPQVADNNNKQTINPIMRKVDSVSEAKKSREARSLKREADGLALGLKGAALERAAFLLGKNGIKDEELLRDAIEAEATKNPKHFIDVLQDPDGDTKAMFHRAISAGVIAADAEDSKLKYVKNQQPIMDVASTVTTDVANEYAQYVNTDSGKKVHTTITNLTEVAEKAAAKKG